MCINRDQLSKSISCAAVYHQRGIAVYQQPSKSKAKALLDDTAVSTRAVYQQQSAKQEHIRRSCISPARYSCYQHPSEVTGKAFLDHTAVSTEEVYQPRKLYINSNRKQFWSTQQCRPGRCLNREEVNQTNFWRSCISPARYSCISTAIKNTSKSASGRHRHVDQGGISTARAVYQQQSKLNRKHF